MHKQRLDKELVDRNLVTSRSQAESYIKLNKVTVNGKPVTKAGFLVSEKDMLELNQVEQYVSRAGMKLASISDRLGLDFRNKVVLDVGSSTGGFTDFALRNGAKKVIAVDVGTDQLHPILRNDPRVELHEKTDIRNFTLQEDTLRQGESLQQGVFLQVDVVVIDVSFISLREILPHIADLSGRNTQIVAMVKPQFESGDANLHKGVIKNDKMRRDILSQFEMWVKKYFVVLNKSDSDVAGAKGNVERFYLLKKIS